MTTQYSHETFSTILTNPDGSTSGIPISHITLTSDEKDVINLAFSSTSPFINPVAEGIAKSQSGITGLTSLLDVRNTTAADPLNGQLTTLINNLAILHNNLNSRTTNLNLINHTNRLSGTSGDKTWLKNDGELYGFAGIQGVAGAYNSVKEAMRDDDDPVEDNYSIFFTSILTAGQSLVSDILDFVDDGVRVDGITVSELVLSEVSGLEAGASAMGVAITDNINADNVNLSFAVDYLKKFGHGNMILGMNKDTYFGRRLLDSVQSDTLKTELDEINQV